MNDYIERDKALAIRHKYEGYMPRDIAHAFWQELNDLPAAPVCEVVTCGECVHHAADDNCWFLNCPVERDYFCCWGERADMRGEEGGPT